MILKPDHNYSESIRQNDEHRHKFDSAITEYIYDNMDAWADNGSGDAECPVGWFSRVGAKRIIRGGESGFVWSEKFDTEYGRDLVHDALEGVYWAWGEDEWDYTDEGEHQQNLQRRLDYLSYVYSCDREQQTPYDYDAWLVRGAPKDFWGVK